MTLVDHLSELRRRLVAVAVVFLASAVVCFHFSNLAVEELVRIAVGAGYRLVYLAPAEMFSQYIKVSLVGALSLSVPLILYEVLAFVRPGLKKKETRMLALALLSGLVFFVGGVVFSFLLIFPFLLTFFFNINASSYVVASVSIANYIDFVMTTLVTFGVIFEMPVVIALLTSLGVITPEMLLKSRKFVIVIIFVVSAVITPPDVVSQLIVAGPMLILFELSTRVSALLYKSRRKRMEAEEACLSGE